MIKQQTAGVVDFEDVNQIKKKNVRGLLRKRAKEYEEASDSADSETETKVKKRVQKASMADAFRSIMAKKITEPGDAPSQTPSQPKDVVLSKYKKKSRDLDAALAKDDEATKKRQLKEQTRLMGRVLPTKEDYEHERSLQIIATKGVVQLFNAVQEYQTSVVKESIKESKEKTEARTAMINSVGKDKNTGAVGMSSIVENIHSKQRKWAVLEDESGDDQQGFKLGEL